MLCDDTKRLCPATFKNCCEKYCASLPVEEDANWESDDFSTWSLYILSVDMFQ